MATLAACAGLTGWWLASNGAYRLPDYWSAVIRPARHARFVADAFAHLMSYGAGFIGGLIVIVWLWWKRGREKTNESD